MIGFILAIGLMALIFGLLALCNHAFGWNLFFEDDDPTTSSAHHDPALDDIVWQTSDMDHHHGD